MYRYVTSVDICFFQSEHAFDNSHASPIYRTTTKEDISNIAYTVETRYKRSCNAPSGSPLRYICTVIFYKRHFHFLTKRYGKTTLSFNASSKLPLNTGFDIPDAEPFLSPKASGFNQEMSESQIPSENKAFKRFF